MTKDMKTAWGDDAGEHADWLFVGKSTYKEMILGTLDSGLRLEEREADEELRSDSDADDEGERNLDLKRRRDGKSGRDWKCDVKGCGKDFKSVS